MAFAPEFVFYLMSNWTSFLAGCVILKDHLVDFNNLKNRDNVGCPANDLNRLRVSRDTEIVLFISNLARVYWSFSPPTVWDHDP